MHYEIRDVDLYEVEQRINNKQSWEWRLTTLANNSVRVIFWAALACAVVAIVGKVVGGA